MATFRTKLATASEAGTMTLIAVPEKAMREFEGRRRVDERTVAVPAFLAKAMTKTERTAFDSVSYSHRKEYLVWIVAAKKPETRDRRVEKLRDKLRDVIP
jgi:uncharacterized protein YdeI (YjbR/CyaY-like superfamily)